MKEVTATIGRDTYRTVLHSGTHEIIGDEPAPYGKDLGPDPYSFLLMALGSCMTMTVRMYADRKQWDLDSVEVSLSQQRVHSKDCEDCVSESSYVHLIEKKVKLSGNLSDKQRERLMEIVDKCPVHKTLLNEIKIKTIEI